MHPIYFTSIDGGILPLNVKLKEGVTVSAKPSQSMCTNISVKEQLKRRRIDKLLQHGCRKTGSSTEPYS
jgi:hypothetical protein